MGLEQSRWMRPVGKCGRKRDIMSDEKTYTGLWLRDWSGEVDIPIVRLGRYRETSTE